jgi:flavin-dependent dehydrogenase
MTISVDVAVLGGGLAGNLLARQLRRELPNLSVAVFERDVERGYKVGESSVEIAAHYWVRRLGLANYFHKEHLPKNGLRFFFDTPERDSELTEMSEIGVDSLPPYPSFQLDRARLERDLIEMNRAAGVDMHMPAEVSDLELSSDGATAPLPRDRGPGRLARAEPSGRPAGWWTPPVVPRLIAKAARPAHPRAQPPHRR